MSVFASSGAAMETPGAPRALRFVWNHAPSQDPSRGQDGARLSTDASLSLSQPALRLTRASGATELYFTRNARGTRNLWRAPIQFDFTPATSEAFNEDDAAPRTRSTVQNKPLIATPVTNVAAPYFVENALPLPDSPQLICVTNAVVNVSREPASGASDAARRSQIARLNPRNGRLSALTAANVRSYSPALSPDGRSLAFVVQNGANEEIYVAQLNENGEFQAPPRRAANMARRPFWLNNDALLFESTRPNQNGLYQIAARFEALSDEPTDEENANRFFMRPGAGATSPDGRHLCIAAQGNRNAFSPDTPNDPTRAASSLYWLASDGSGARAVSSTEGADNPFFAPDGSAVLYDAPAASENVLTQDRADAARELWMIPMLRVPPTALLADARAVTKLSTDKSGAEWQEIEVIGTAFAPGDDAPQVKLEWGEGSEPTRWNSFDGVRAPVHSSTLAKWRVPSDARGIWTLRLSVTDSSGDRAESILPVTLPLLPEPATEPDSAPPIFARSDPTRTEILPDAPAQVPGRNNTRATNATARDDQPRSNQSRAGRSGNSAPPTNVQPRSTSEVPGSVQASTQEPTSLQVLPPFDPSTLGAPARSSAPRADARTRAATRRAPQNLQIATPQAAAQAIAALPPPASEPVATNEGAVSTPVRTAPVTGQTKRPAMVPAPPAATRTPSRTPDFPDIAAPVNPATEARGGPLPSAVASLPATRQNWPPLESTQSRSASSELGVRRNTTAAKRATTTPRRAVVMPRQASSSNRADAGIMRAAGLSTTLNAGEELNIGVGLRNTGRRAWSSGDAQPVRLLVRWHDAATGRRSRWEIKWLRADVAPGTSAQLNFDVTVPPRAGRFVLHLALVRLENGRYEPPSIDTRRDENEFASITYRVTVR